MTMIVVEVYDAMKQAGADEDTAMRAAAAAYTPTTPSVERSLTALKRMTSVSLAVSAATLIRLLAG